MEDNLFLDTVLALWSLAVGGFLCAVYDVFRLCRLRRKQNSVLLFFCDLAFCGIAAVTMLVLFFNLSFGSPRFYAFVFALLGFLLWRFTVSRFVMFLMMKLIDLAERLLISIKMRVFAFVSRLSRRIYTFSYCRNTVMKSKKGFGIIKRKEFKNDTKETYPH